MYWIWCEEGEQVWVEARVHSYTAAVDVVNWLSKKVPGRKVWFEEVRD